MKIKSLIIFFVLFLIIGCNGKDQTEEKYLIPEEVLFQVMTIDPSSRLIEIEANDKEDRYIFVGNSVFGISDKRTDFYVGETSLTTIAAFKPEDYIDYKTIKSWNISYEEAQKIAKNIDKPFSVEILNQGTLRNRPINEQCGAMTNPFTNSLIHSKNSYWRIHGFEEMRVFEIYIDSFNGEVIHTCYGPRK